MELYERVKATAKEKGLSIAALERKAGVANGTIGKWLTNNGPAVATLDKIAKALEMELRDLL